MSYLSRIRRQHFPTDEEKIFDEIERDLTTVEVNDWIGSLIDYMAFDPRAYQSKALPPDTIESWRRLSEWQREMAFLYLLGSVRSLIQPPQENGDYSSVNA